VEQPTIVRVLFSKKKQMIHISLGTSVPARKVIHRQRKKFFFVFKNFVLWLLVDFDDFFLLLFKISFSFSR